MKRLFASLVGANEALRDDDTIRAIWCVWGVVASLFPDSLSLSSPALGGGVWGGLLLEICWDLALICLARAGVSPPPPPRVFSPTKFLDVFQLAILWCPTRTPVSRYIASEKLSACRRSTNSRVVRDLSPKMTRLKRFVEIPLEVRSAASRIAVKTQ